MNALTLSILILATWRLASLFANEEGPFKVFKKIREYCKELDRRSRVFHKTYVYYGLLCEWCNSIWFGALLSIGYAWLHPLPLETLIPLPLALSAGAVFIKFVIQTLSAAKEHLETLTNNAKELQDRSTHTVSNWEREEIGKIHNMANFANVEQGEE